MRSTIRNILVLVTILCFPACHDSRDSSRETAAEANVTPAADKPFVAGGKVNVDLDGGSYEIKAAADNHIRVSVSDTRTTKVDVATDGSQATVKVKDTPHSNFHAIIEVPATGEIVVRLSGGELKIDRIAGNKDVESYAGNVQIAVGDAKDYARVDAAVKAGDLDASPFGGSKSGLLQQFTWSGDGKYMLRAHLGAGNLVLSSK